MSKVIAIFSMDKKPEHCDKCPFNNLGHLECQWHGEEAPHPPMPLIFKKSQNCFVIWKDKK